MKRINELSKIIQPCGKVVWVKKEEQSKTEKAQNLLQSIESKEKFQATSLD